MYMYVLLVQGRYYFCSALLYSLLDSTRLDYAHPDTATPRSHRRALPCPCLALAGTWGDAVDGMDDEKKIE
jgi:hypothetical protein